MKNTLSFIQNKINNWYILTYISNDIINPDTMIIYNMLDLMTFSQSDAIYINWLLSYNPQILELKDYSLALIPLDVYIWWYILNFENKIISDETNTFLLNWLIDIYRNKFNISNLNNIDEDFITRNIYSDTDDNKFIGNIYNLLIQTFNIENNNNVIDLSNIILSFNKDNNTMKSLLLSKYQNTFKFSIIDYIISLLTLKLSENKTVENNNFIILLLISLRYNIYLLINSSLESFNNISKLNEIQEWYIYGLNELINLYTVWKLTDNNDTSYISEIYNRLNQWFYLNAFIKINNDMDWIRENQLDFSFIRSLLVNIKEYNEFLHYTKILYTNK